MLPDPRENERLRALARSLARQFADNALSVAENQVALAGEQPQVAKTWRQVALLLRENSLIKSMVD